MMVFEDREEENSFDMNDVMSDEEMGIGGGPEVQDVESSDGNSGDANHPVPVPQRGRKRQRGVKVGAKVIVEVQSSSRQSSEVWNYFEKVEVPSQTEPGLLFLKAKCMYCFKHLSYVGGGCTSHLARHRKSCAAYKRVAAKKANQALLNFGPSNASDSGIPVLQSPSEYNHEQTRKLLAKMIIVHEYPFRMVEHTWFNILMKYLNPFYQFIGRKTIRGECLKVFESKREILMKSFKDVNGIALTTDLWTFNQTISYMCLVAHYIDSNWKMQCRVLNFIELDPPHTGNVIAQAVFECVAAWKIEDKIISITLDNASNNDVAVRGLKAKFAARASPAFIPRYFHIRCCAHIINLVVNDGIAKISHLITNVRESVKYIKKSPSRLYKFIEICRSLALTIGEGLKLDVSTRWNSTYNMLRTAIAYKEALTSYADTDANYKWEPSWDEWVVFESIQPILKSLAEVTTAFSASTYPTSNIFYPHIINVKIALRAACASSDEHLCAMGTAMMEKFNKYWEEKYYVMVLATILDPRYKLKYIAWAFYKIYEPTEAMVEIEDVKRELDKLYEKYEMDHRHQKAAAKKSGASSSSTVDTNTSLPSSSSEFQSFLFTSSLEPSKSELPIYLDEQNETLANKWFNLLHWCQLNAHRYPVVSKMAKNFLTILVTSVSSESTFSTGGRVLDDYRSSLRPAMVESLVCASSWIRGAHNDMTAAMIVEEYDEDDVELIPFPKSMVESNYSTNFTNNISKITNAYI